MGRLGRTHYVPELSVLMRDDNAMVRSTALRALIAIRQTDDQSLPGTAEEGIVATEKISDEMVSDDDDMLIR